MSQRRIPSLNWLRVFEAAARTGSFAAAARILNMSPAAVSQQIKALETHLNSRLFDRGPKHVTPTEAASSFLPVVQAALLSVETTATSLFGARRRREVTVQATLIFLTSWLIDRLPDFEAAHPDIRLHLVGGYYDTDIHRDGPDLYVTFGAPLRNSGDSDLLFGETIYPAARPDIAAAIRRPEDLLAHRLIEISTHRMSWLQMLEATDLGERGDLDVRFTDTSEVALTLAAAGQGVALARAPATDGLMRRFGLERCQVDLELAGAEAYHLVCRSPASLSPAARAARDWLLEATEAYR